MIMTVRRTVLCRTRHGGLPGGSAGLQWPVTVPERLPGPGRADAVGLGVTVAGLTEADGGSAATVTVTYSATARLGPAPARSPGWAGGGARSTPGWGVGVRWGGELPVGPGSTGWASWIWLSSPALSPRPETCYPGDRTIK
jgi:hypothetical protein